MSLTTQEISTIIQNSAPLTALAEQGKTQEIADLINSNRTQVVSVVLPAGKFHDMYPEGPIAAETILVKIENIQTKLLGGDAEQRVIGSFLRRQLARFDRDGIDFGSPSFRTVLDLLLQLGELTDVEITALKQLAVSNVKITHTDVGEALKLKGAGK